MKKYNYNCKVTLGSQAAIETESMKQAMVSFLHAFSIKPCVEKILCGKSPQTDYYYLAEFGFSDNNLMRVLRFAESLRGFCGFWRMGLFEDGLFEENS